MKFEEDSIEELIVAARVVVDAMKDHHRWQPRSHQSTYRKPRDTKHIPVGFLTRLARCLQDMPELYTNGNYWVQNGYVPANDLTVIEGYRARLHAALQRVDDVIYSYRQAQGS
jgi:hypothetical protein